jgi:hypothetical protein
MTHTGYGDCPVRPLHDPCHAGRTEDGRTLSDMTVGSVLLAWRKQVRGTADGPPAADGHELARQLIAKHGVDRYPTVGANFSKLLDEAGELAEALMERYAAQHVPHEGGTAEGCPGCFADREEAHVREEYADVGITLYELGTKLGLNLIECMRALVLADERTFAIPPEQDRAWRDMAALGEELQGDPE